MKNTSSDLQGISRLLTDANLGITDVVESMHKEIIYPPIFQSTRIQDRISLLSGMVYKTIRWSTVWVGYGMDKLLHPLGPLFGELKDTDRGEALRSALNGVVGDYLESVDNPLKITMRFRYQANPISFSPNSLSKIYSAINGKILLMVHGACMNDIQWSRKGHNHGDRLAKELGKTPIYLHYNSGHHISTNGKNLDELLEGLVKEWPVPVEEIVIIAHSMGGLVSRSATYYGQLQQRAWTNHLSKIIFLGTPHQGAPLEIIGNYLHNILKFIPYAKAIAPLAKIRSAGITDLRYGNIIDEDWLDTDRFKLQSDKRKNVSLPKDVDCYTVAGTTDNASMSLSSRCIGDNLVGVKSALGQHKKISKRLNFKKEHIWIAYENTHLDLLSDRGVYNKIKEWIMG